MRLNDLREVTTLAGTLRSLNKQIDDLHYLKFDDDARTRHLAIHLGPALRAAREILRRDLASERNRVLQLLRQYGVTFDDE